MSPRNFLHFEKYHVVTVATQAYLVSDTWLDGASDTTKCPVAGHFRSAPDDE